MLLYQVKIAIDPNVLLHRKSNNFTQLIHLKKTSAFIYYVFKIKNLISVNKDIRIAQMKNGILNFHWNNLIKEYFNDYFNGILRRNTKRIRMLEHRYPQIFFVIRKLTDNDFELDGRIIVVHLGKSFEVRDVVTATVHF